MSKSLNQCNFIGNLGSDPETKYMPNGTAVTNISIGVSDDYKDKSGQKVEQTEWVRVSAFGKLAEIMAQYLRKGSKVFISGKMVTRSWEQDGVKKYSTEIKAENMQMLDSKNSQAGATPSPAHPAPSSQQDSFDDTIPF